LGHKALFFIGILDFLRGGLPYGLERFPRDCRIHFQAGTDLFRNFALKINSGELIFRFARAKTFLINA
jgi:hypothetical protein